MRPRGLTRCVGSRTFRAPISNIKQRWLLRTSMYWCVCIHSRSFLKHLFPTSFARARSTSSWGGTSAHLNSARYDRLGATLSLVFSDARTSVNASATLSQSSNARSVMFGWESKTRMKTPDDVTNWLVIWDHARHVGLYRLKSTLEMSQMRAPVCAFDCGLRKMIAKVSLLFPSTDGRPTCRHWYRENRQTSFLVRERGCAEPQTRSRGFRGRDRRIHAWLGRPRCVYCTLMGRQGH